MKGEERGHKQRGDRKEGEREGYKGGGRKWVLERGDRGGREGEGKSTVGCFSGQRENFSTRVVEGAQEEGCWSLLRADPLTQMVG